MAETARQTVQICNKRGLHARASAKFVAAVSMIEGCDVRVAKDGMEAAGGSILGLMMLGAAEGDTIEIVVSGTEADKRLAELTELVSSGFGEN